MHSQDAVGDDELGALKAKARNLRKRGLSFAEVGKRIGRSGQTVRRWLKKRVATKQRETFQKYIESEKGREARRRYEAKRCAARKAAKDLRDQMVGQMFD